MVQFLEDNTPGDPLGPNVPGSSMGSRFGLTSVNQSFPELLEEDPRDTGSP